MRDVSMAFFSLRTTARTFLLFAPTHPFHFNMGITQYTA